MAGVNYWIKRQFAEYTTIPASLTRRGLVYHLSTDFTLTGNEALYFVFSIPVTDVEIEFYDFYSDTTTVKASLIQAPTVGSTVSSFTPRNLNRNYPDSSAVSLYSVATMTGGTEVSTELFGSASKAGGVISQHKHFVLSRNTLYGMTFVNQVNQTTRAHVNLGWSENEPEATRLWSTTGPQD